MIELYVFHVSRFRQKMDPVCPQNALSMTHVYKGLFKKKFHSICPLLKSDFYKKENICFTLKDIFSSPLNPSCLSNYATFENCI